MGGRKWSVSGWEADTGCPELVWLQWKKPETAVFPQSPQLCFTLLGSFFVFLSQMNEQFQSAPKFIDTLLRGTSHQPTCIRSMDCLAVATEG